MLKELEPQYIVCLKHKIHFDHNIKYSSESLGYFWGEYDVGTTKKWPTQYVVA